MRLIGAHPNCVVLVDHHAIEDRFARVLEMLHAYDEPSAQESNAEISNATKCSPHTPEGSSSRVAL